MFKSFKILSGVVLIALAIFSLCVRAEFLGIFAFAVAFSLLFFGCIKLFIFLNAKEDSYKMTTFLLDGIFGILLGTILLFRGYAETAETFLIALCTWGIILGIFRALLSANVTKASKRLFYLIFGLIGVALGLLILWHSILDLTFEITFFISALFMVYAIYDIVEASIENVTHEEPKKEIKKAPKKEPKSKAKK